VASADSTDPEEKAQRETKPRASDTMKSLVQVESMIQLALMVPVGTMVGWGMGLLLDKWLHQHWIYIAGLIVGAVAGFVEIFRVVLRQMKE
jgi:F0F1-type ATP synthase assembly protein I